MPGETWTIGALAKHVDAMLEMILARITEMDVGWNRATALALENARLERARASEQVDARLAGMNEFRDAMKDQAGRFVTRRELWAYLAGLVMAMTAVITLALRFAG